MSWSLYGSVEDHNIWFYTERKLKRIWVVRLKVKGEPRGVGGYYELSSALRVKGLSNDAIKRTQTGD